LRQGDGYRRFAGGGGAAEIKRRKGKHGS
jgi:hypothetical protein